MSFPVDKTQVIQTALTVMGQNVPNDADDGSPEWNVASAAYEEALPYAIEGHDWKFSTTVAILTPSPTAPTDPLFNTAYAKPQDMLHLIWVRVNDTPVEYQILDNQIILNVGGSTAVATAKYVRGISIDGVTPTFVVALGAFVKSGIYRGLNKDTDAADKEWAKGEMFLGKARTRSDQEAPKRSIFRSGITAARQNRLPGLSSSWPWDRLGS